MYPCISGFKKDIAVYRQAQERTIKLVDHAAMGNNSGCILRCGLRNDSREDVVCPKPKLQCGFLSINGIVHGQSADHRIFFIRDAPLQSGNQAVVKLHQLLLDDQGGSRCLRQMHSRLKRSLQGTAINRGNVKVFLYKYRHGFCLPMPAFRQGKIRTSLVYIEQIRFGFPVPDNQ